MRTECKTSVLDIIVDKILGRKYWANIVNMRGTNRVELSCYIFRTAEGAERHRQSLENNATFRVVDTVSFRTRTDYKNLTLVSPQV